MDAATMKPMIWHDKYSVGNEEIDLQHRRIIGMVNDALATRQGLANHEITTDEVSQATMDILIRMLAYAQVHFITEEDLMIRNVSPNYFTHRDEHFAFVRKLSNLCYQALSGQSVKVQIDDVLDFLATWWTTHILETDKKEAKWFVTK